MASRKKNKKNLLPPTISEAVELIHRVMMESRDRAERRAAKRALRKLGYGGSVANIDVSRCPPVQLAERPKPKRSARDLERRRIWLETKIAEREDHPRAAPESTPAPIPVPVAASTPADRPQDH